MRLQVLVVPPMHIMDACYVQIPPTPPKKPKSKSKGLQAEGEGGVNIVSDVTEVDAHPNASSFDQCHTYAFPLGGAGPYLCSQGACGQFTHFYPATLHAIDLVSGFLATLQETAKRFSRDSDSRC